MSDLNTSFWNKKYHDGATGWDLNKASQPLETYIDSLNNTNLKILIPGAGNAYEAEYLWNKGFHNIHVLDFAEEPLTNLKKRLPDLPNDQILLNNFFDHSNQYDLILEQTFFCALSPALRTKYKDHMYKLLRPKAVLAGLFFDFPLTEHGPPFGGTFESYKTLFQNEFKIITLERCYNSEPSRMGKELFFIFEKK